MLVIIDGDYDDETRVYFVDKSDGKDDNCYDVMRLMVNGEYLIVDSTINLDVNYQVILIVDDDFALEKDDDD